MKKLNKKGFTLIELLAVIVILALLVAVAIPAVTKYLNTSRKGVFADNAAAAISAVRNESIFEGNIPTDGKVYTINKTNDDGTIVDGDVNKFLEKQLKKSPYNRNYSGTVTVKIVNDAFEYSIFLTDGVNCIGTKDTPLAENLISDKAVTVGNEKTCGE